MEEIFKLLIGIGTLILGVFIGKVLAKVTKEELKAGKKWFKIIVLVSLLGGLIALIIRNDILMFTFFFIAIVTCQSLQK